MAEKTGARRKAAASADATARKSIGILLIEAGVLQKGHVREALTIQKEKGGKLLDILMALGHLDPRAFAKFLSEQRGIPSLDLSNYQVPAEIVEIVPPDFAREHQVFPIDKMGKLLTLGMECPLDTEAIVRLERITGLKVKPILCSGDDIRNAVEHNYSEKPVTPEAGTEAEADAESENVDSAIEESPPPAKPEPSEAQIESGIRLKNVVNHIREIDALPTLPRTVERVKEATENPNTTFAVIGAIIESDPPIAARLLRLANSAAYGFPNRVDDIAHATSLLGPRETYNVVLSSAILELTEHAEGFDHHRYWDDSMFCATAARFVANTVAPALASSAYMAGLLHDIGRYALSHTAPGIYAKIGVDLVGSALISAERRAYLIAHPEAGYFLAAHWGLPEDISDAIRFHHTPNLSRLESKLAYLVAIAARMTEFRHEPHDEDTPLPEECGAFGADINLAPEHAARIFASTCAAMDA